MKGFKMTFNIDTISTKLFNSTIDNTQDKLIKLPNNDNIKIIIKNFKKIIFNNYCYFENFNNINDLLVETINILQQEIKLALCYEDFTNNNTKKCCINKSLKLTQAFIDYLPEIQNDLIEDIKTTFKYDPASINYEEIILCYPGIDALVSYRIAHALDNLNVPYIPRIISYLAQNKTGIEIHPKAQLNSGIMIDHGTGIVIGETCVIGNNVRIYQGVTLGAISVSNRDNTNKNKRHPTIENNVTIYANATILGGDTIIGENSVIGGNVFITNSIDKNTIVMSEKQNYVYKRKTK